MQVTIRAAKTGPQPQVSSILVKGFKSFKREQRIDLKPLTVLAGANSGGKSAFFQLLLLLKQTVESESDPGSLLLNGDSAKFTELSQLFWRPAGGTGAQTMSLGLIDSDGRAIRQFYERNTPGVLELNHLQTRTHGVPQDFRIGYPYKLRDLPYDVLDDLDWEPIGYLLAHSPFRTNTRLRLIRRRGLLRFEMRATLDEPHSGVWIEFHTPLQPLADLAEGMIHLPGLRGSPERDYPKRAVGDHFPGAFQDYVASIIAGWDEKKDKSKIQKLDGWIRRLGLGHAVRARAMNDAAYEVILERNAGRSRGAYISGDTVNIADVGLGVSQVLPVLVALLARSRGRLVYIEQPEIHLHPRAQKEMASLLAEEAVAGARIVVETHSSVFLLGLQTAIAKGRIKPEDVALYWFKQDEFGASTATKANVDEYGRTGAWPADFDDILLEAQGEYVNAVAKAARRHERKHSQST